MKKIVLFMVAAMVLTSAVFGMGGNEGKEGGLANFPKAPITLICPWAAGGSSDATMRAIAEIGPDYFGVPMNVVNRDGAGGTVATTEFVNEKPDGYTICLEAIGVFTTQPFMRDVKYSMDDFRPVIGLTAEPIVMVASAKSGISNIEDMKKLGRAVTYGFSGSGSLMELAQKNFFATAKIEASAVPFDGGAPTMTALLGGHIDIGAAHPGELMQYIESGDLVPIGIFNPERDSRPGIKEIPTFVEQGYDIDMSVWKFLILPKAVPDDIANYITENMGKILADERFVDFAAKTNLLITPYTPEEVLTKVTNEAAVNKALFGK